MVKLFLASLVLLLSKFAVVDKFGVGFGIYIFCFLLIMISELVPSNYKISKEIKIKYPVLYNKYSGRPYGFRGLRDVEYFRFTQSELSLITDEQIRNRIIYNVQFFKNNCVIFIVTIIAYSLIASLI